MIPNRRWYNRRQRRTQLLRLTAFVSTVAVGLLTTSVAAQEVKLPPGFARVVVQTLSGPVSVTLPRREFHFKPSGSTFYLAAKGDDAAAGSKEHPWATFSRALSALKPGELLYVRGGDYAQPFTINRSGEPGRPIIITACPGETVRVFQPEGWQSQNVHGATVTLQGAKYVWLHGFVIEGSLGRPQAPPNDCYGQNGITLSGGAGEGVWIINNIVSRGQHCGIKEMAHGGRRFLIEGNVVFDNGATDHRDHGLYIPSQEAVIRGNAIFHSKGYGLHLYSDPAKCHVYNNILFENGASGIIVSGPDNVIAHNVCTRNKGYGLFLFRGGCKSNTFVNNVFWDNGGAQIAMDNGGGAPGYGTPADNVIDYNLIFPKDGWAAPATIFGWAGAHTLFGEPQVVDAQQNDLRLQKASLGRNAGCMITLKGAPVWPDIGLFPATRYRTPAW